MTPSIPTLIPEIGKPVQNDGNHAKGHDTTQTPRCKPYCLCNYVDGIEIGMKMIEGQFLWYNQKKKKNESNYLR